MSYITENEFVFVTCFPSSDIKNINQNFFSSQHSATFKSSIVSHKSTKLNCHGLFGVLDCSLKGVESVGYRMKDEQVRDEINGENIIRLAGTEKMDTHSDQDYQR